MVTVNGLPVQRACRAVGMSRAMYDRPLLDWARRDAPVIAALMTLWWTRRAAGASGSVAIGSDSMGIPRIISVSGVCIVSSG